MVFDLIALFIIGFFAMAGWARGFVAMLFTFVGLLAAWIGSRHLAGWLEGNFDWSMLDPGARYWVFLAGAAAILYLGTNFVGFLVAHLYVGKDEERRRSNRWWGLALGLVEGVILAFFFASLVGAAPDTLRQNWDWLDRTADESRLVEWVEPINPITERRDELARVAKLAELLDILSDPERIDELELSGKTREALRDTGLRELLANSDFVEALREADYTKLFSKEHWRKTLQDEDLQRALESVDLDEVRREVREAREAAETTPAEENPPI